jgi:putative ABC transport system substrate-binding protein
VVLEWAEGRFDQLPRLAAELVSRRVDLIFVNGVPAARAAKQATATIPIVVALVGAPVECGLVASLARPGGNLTGGAWVDLDFIGKHLELLKEIRPKLSRIGMLWDPANCADSGSLAALQAASQTVKVQVLDFPTRTLEEIERTLPLLVRGRAEALLVGGPFFYQQRRAIADLAKRERLPVVSNVREFAVEGALLTYGPNLVAANRRAAIYVDKILKGARPADLPMERPREFELVINLKTAKALKLTIPPAVLARAEIIE